MNEEYINETILKILGLQNPGDNFNPFGNTELNQQTLEQLFINRILDIRNLEVKGDYVVDSEGNEVPIVETVKSTILNREGYPVTFEKNRFYTMDDGTSKGEFAECMNCGEIVSKKNLFQCSGCGKTVCVLCESRSESGKHYCGGWHKFLGGDGIF